MGRLRRLLGIPEPGEAAAAVEKAPVVVEARQEMKRANAVLDAIDAEEVRHMKAIDTHIDAIRAERRRERSSGRKLERRIAERRMADRRVAE